MTSMNRPSRAARESATTTRYAGFFVVPVRLSRMWAATGSPRSRCGHRGGDGGVLWEHPVPARPGRAPPRGGGGAPAAVDDRRRGPLARRHGGDDRLEPLELVLLALELPGHALAALEERHHVHELV